MTELALQTYVVICRQTGVYYIDKQKANKLEEYINSNNPPKSVKISPDATVMISDIVGIVSANRYDEIKRERKGQWKCNQGVWHAKDEVCKCNWGATRKAIDPPKEPEMKVSPEEAEKNKIILALIRAKKVSFRDMKSLKSKSIDELQKL